MALDNPPLWLENAGEVYHARSYRRMLHAIYGGRCGILTAGSFKVTEHAGTPNLSVDIAAGAAIIANTTVGDAEGSYPVTDWEGGANLAVSAGGAATRVDLVVVRVRDSETAGATDSAVYEIVEGTEGAGTPATPDNSFVLATLTVPAAAASITTSMISDQRYVSGGSSALLAPWGAAWGELAATELSSLTAAGTTLADIAGLAATARTPAGRILEVRVKHPMRLTADGDRARSYVRESSTTKGTVGDWKAGRANNDVTVYGAVRISNPSAGAHTYKVSVEAVTGNWDVGTSVSATQKAVLQIVDVGPVRT